MDVLTLSVACVLCTAQPAVPVPDSLPWRTEITAASRRFAVPEAWISAVIRAESGGRTTLQGRPITSVAGAMGLMQVMPGTYDALRMRYGLGPNPYHPQDNILAGTAYLREMYERYGYPYLFVAYNAGPRRLDDFLSRGRSLPAATITYVDSLIPHASELIGALHSSPKVLLTACKSCEFRRDERPSNRLFFTLTAAPSHTNTPSESPHPARTLSNADAPKLPSTTGALFVPLSQNPP
ncbi:MAG: lytic transglycosylase domain-containing protein [Alphaproteobacteria bacterium]|nr:lytic transglycosylase domain-containing protein [Alphaproteobacteria bacterium]MDE2112917.1 lytic transglycosylase domain-containing protein [Alphaproteobacteria bacterium]MDE2493786.1 lytic transglycosylase domain-containing protein [Alphaproteobacteria bacterium]